MENRSAAGHAPSGGGTRPSSWPSDGAGSRAISWRPTTAGRRKSAPSTQTVLCGHSGLLVLRTPKWTDPTCTSASSNGDPCGNGPRTASALPGVWSLSLSSAVPQSTTGADWSARVLTTGGQTALSPGAGGNPTSRRSPDSTTGSARSGTSQSPRDSGSRSISLVVNTSNTEGPVRSCGAPLRCSLKMGRETWWANMQQAISAWLFSEAISHSLKCMILSVTTGRQRRINPSISPCKTTLSSTSPSSPGARPASASSSGGWKRPPRQSEVARCWSSLRNR
mmetsp:Transcript_62784/g.144595  ORF Transcript_62784/g.144595 Transcript_62784/m.144595 type:complete len:280 (-) Transcript_62784:1051-1890(-)